jgi:hypothetical protein
MLVGHFPAMLRVSLSVRRDVWRAAFNLKQSLRSNSNPQLFSFAINSFRLKAEHAA